MRTITVVGVASLIAFQFAASPLAAQVHYSFSRQLVDAFVDTTGGPEAIAAADVDQIDGPDILAVEPDAAVVDVYLNDGAGDFSDGASCFETDDGPVAVAAAVPPMDLNNDGLADLVTANNVGTVSILLGTGDGEFDDTSDNRDVNVGPPPVGVVVADFDRDGKQDIAALNNNSVFLLRGNGDGTFVPFATPLVQTLTSGNAAVVADDFDGNGTTDLAVSGGQSLQVSVLLGDGHGGFARARLFGVGSLPRGLAASDFNGDGKLDIAVADSDTNLFDENVSILLGQGDGTFVGANPPAEGGGEGVTSVAAADLDGDGRPEISVTGLSSETVDVLENCSLDQATKCPPPQPIIGGGLFQLQSTISGLNLGDFQVAIASGDFNRDGRMDLVALSQAGDTLGVFLNSTGVSTPTAVTPGTFTPTPPVSFTPTPIVPTSTFTATATLTSTPTPTPIPTAPYGLCSTNDVGQPAVGGKPVAAAVGSFIHGNGSSPTIAIADNLNNKIIFLQTSIHETAPNACGVLGLSRDLSQDITVSSPIALSAIDLDRDGNLDLVVVGAAGLSVFYGDGAGSFVPGAGNPMEVPGIPHSIATADLNRDGLPDVIVGNDANTATGNDVAIFLNVTGRSFEPICTISVGRRTSLVVTGDLNRDGRQDFAVGSDQTNDISVFLQLAPTPTSTPGTFLSSSCQTLASSFGGRAPLPPVSPTLRGLVVDSFDPTDSIPDLAVVVSPTSGEGSAVVFLGSPALSGDVTYTRRGNPLSVPPSASRPSALASADINLDGRNDLIVSDEANDDVVIFLAAADGSFSTPLNPFPIRGTGPVALAVADIDGDGKPDIVTANAGDGSVSIMVSSKPPATPTPLPTGTPTLTGTPTATPTPTPSGTPTSTPTPSSTPTSTRTRTATFTSPPGPTTTLKPGTLNLSSCAIGPADRSTDKGGLLVACVAVAALGVRRRLGYRSKR